MMTLDGEAEVGGKEMVVRSNWKRYLEEFAMAVGVWEEVGGGFRDWKQCFMKENNGGNSDEDNEWHPNKTLQGPDGWEMNGPKLLCRDESSVSVPWTNFEAKYLASKEPVYEISFRKSLKLKCFTNNV